MVDKSEKHSKKHDKTDKPGKLRRKEYEEELRRLQVELVKLQDWVKREGKRVVIIFEGRDAAGKGGVIKRITQRVSSRVFRVVALPTPSDREKTEWYWQRFVRHLPAAGEIVLFDRSWYNRAGVEKVMGFCNDDEYRQFLVQAPSFESAIVDDGIVLLKYWLTISCNEQEKRFHARIDEPDRQWKLSPIDLQALKRWYDYSRARDAMFAATDTDHAPWWVVQGNNKRQARLNCISHILNTIPYKEVEPLDIKIPSRGEKNEYDDVAVMKARRFVPELF